MDYVTVKWLHILSSTILFGAGVGSAFHFVLAVRGRDVQDIAATAHHVVVQDWLFIVQPVTGFWLMHLAGIPLSTPWIRWSLALYAFAIACWLPVVWIQLRLRAIARVADERDEPLPRQWWRLFAAWVVLGAVAFFAFLAIFHLMVAKR